MVSVFHPLKRVQTIADRLGLYVQAYTLYSSVRPFGSSALVATMSPHHGPELYMIEPSGLYWVTSSWKAMVFLTSQQKKGYHGCAIGKGKSVAKTEIEKLNLKEMTAREAVKQAAKMWVSSRMLSLLITFHRQHLHRP